MPTFQCHHCRRRLEEAPPLWRCTCGGPLYVVHTGRLDPAVLAARPPTIWRYREAIGIPPDTEPVTLGEGMTPTVALEVMGLATLFKMEMLMPTGSFKDRGASVVMSELRFRGEKAAVEDSSGNAGAAMAAFGSRAGIEVQVVAPADAPGAKLAAIEAHGGTLTRVAEGRAAASQEAERRAREGIPFASHVWNPYFLEGTQTFAFEVWEQSGGGLPPRIFFPVGNGSLILGSALGFQRLVEQHLAAAPPRLMAVQAEACSPLGGGAPKTPGFTVADGIRIAAPPRARAIQEEVRLSGGEIVSVPEGAILQAQAALGRAGLAVEPTSAVAFAGALAWSRRAGPDEAPPLVALTGSALKALS